MRSGCSIATRSTQTGKLPINLDGPKLVNSLSASSTNKFFQIATVKSTSEFRENVVSRSLART